MKKSISAHKPIIIIITACAVIILICIIIILFRAGTALDPMSVTPSVSTPGPEDSLPQGLISGETIAMSDVIDSQGEQKALYDVITSNSNNKATMIVMFDNESSESNDQLLSADEIKGITDENDIQLIFLFSQRDQFNTSSASFTENSTVPVYYDMDGAAYSAWKIQEYPTSIIVNDSGRVLAYSSGIMSSSEYQSLIDKAVKGPDASLLSFVQKNMISDGGMYTGTERKNEVVPSGRDVLSESQGLLMQYAVLSDNRDLFDKTWEYTRENMQSDGLFSWYVTEDGSKADSDALLDDMRIYSALDDASALWGDSSFADEASAIRKSISKYCIQDNGTPVSFINFHNKAKSDTISLCYLDISTISKMAAYDNRISTMNQQSASILSNGMIDTTFPLYYGNYNVHNRKYGKDDLNMAEALYTLWNLAKADKLDDESYAWLSERVYNGDLAASYKVNGSVPEGYEYHSTAVYGLAALIAGAKGDKALHEKALQRMERYRINDAGSEYYGGFGIEGENFSSFDQCIPLIVYRTKLSAE